MKVRELRRLLDQQDPNENVGIQIVTVGSSGFPRAALYVGEEFDYPKIRDAAFPSVPAEKALTYTTALQRVIVVTRGTSYREVKP